MSGRTLGVQGLMSACLLLVSCVAIREARKTPERCVTYCGLTVITSDCRNAKAAESVALAAFHRNTHWKYAASCSALKGWTVKVHEKLACDRCVSPDWWSPLHNSCLSGVAFLKEKRVEVTSEEFGTNAFAHEIAHIIGYTNEGAAGHCGWDKIRAALREATGRPDYTEAEEWCPK